MYLSLEIVVQNSKIIFQINTFFGLIKKETQRSIIYALNKMYYNYYSPT